MTSALQVDRTFLDESLPQLQDYLLSGELYWNLGYGVPSLSIGNVLLALVRLDVVEPAKAQQMRGKVDAVREKWHVAWTKKAAREAANRLRLWSQFLSEQQSTSGRSKAYYATEVRGRAILQLLLKEVPTAPEKATLAELDSALRGQFHPGKFVWGETYRPAFPPDEFWFLYGNL
jgi:DNA-binding PucR family transcriptional regulator